MSERKEEGSGVRGQKAVLSGTLGTENGVCCPLRVIIDDDVPREREGVLKPGESVVNGAQFARVVGGLVTVKVEWVAWVSGNRAMAEGEEGALVMGWGEVIGGGKGNRVAPAGLGTGGVGGAICVNR